MKLVQYPQERETIEATVGGEFSRGRGFAEKSINHDWLCILISSTGIELYDTVNLRKNFVLANICLNIKCVDPV